MPITIQDFEYPSHHPHGMLHSHEDEATLVCILAMCIVVNDLHAAIPLQYNHRNMVESGLLRLIDNNTYQLTIKSIGLLYSIYGKEGK